MKGKVGKIFFNERTVKGRKAFAIVAYVDKEKVNFGLSQKEEAPFKEGDFIEVETTEDQYGTKADLKTLKVVQGKKESNFAKGGPQQSSGTNWDKRDEDIKAGMFFNNAVQLSIASNKGINEQLIVGYFRMLEKAYAECRNGAAEEQPRPQARDGDEPEFDDDIPF